jgi:hypothetical protein
VKEPLRLLNDAQTSISMRQALSAAGDAPPLPPAIRAAMSDVAAQLTTTAVATGTAVSTKSTVVLLKSIGIKVAGKGLLVAACLGVGAGTAFVARPLFVGSSAGQKTVVTVVQPATKPVTQHAEAASQAIASSVSEPSLAPRPPRVPSTVEPRFNMAADKTNVAPPVQESKIASEARLLERARSHLASNPALALAETNQHLERFGEGQMSAERELIAVEALLRLGRRAEAESRAAPRLRLDPSGLYAKRLRQVFTEF